MKKSAVKNKAAEGCMKISSFFSKRSDCGKPPNKTIVTPVASETINLDSEEEESESLLNFKSKAKQKKRKFEPQDTDVLPPMKKGGNETNSQPSTSGTTLCNKAVQTSCVTPSKSGETPVKVQPILSVKSPEKLFGTAALTEYQSPRKSNSPIKTKKVNLEQDSTPDKQKSAVSGSSTKKSSGNKTSETSPNRSKKTPKKLFEKSPNNLNKFNVEILINFVKITPSKKEVEDHESKKKQNSALEVQQQNEKTPVKDLLPSTSYSSPISKVRAKLNFTSCTVSLDKTNSVKNCPPIEAIATAKLSEKENHDINNTDFTIEDDSWEFGGQLDYNLDLTKSQHCKIISINQRTTETIITVKSTQMNEQALCTLQGFWTDCKLCIWDTVHVMATKSHDDNWVIDNNGGFLVFEPDLLISTTSLINSVFCKRRTVFKERFRGFDLTNKYMIVGSMAHSLMQDVLRKKIYDLKNIEKCAVDILNQKEWIRQIYESSESLAFIAEEFLNYIPKVHKFLETYIQNNKEKTEEKTDKKDNWKGTISGIDDIEENIWCPSLGVKGKVDVSIKNGNKQTMPLEIKTGRATVSLEHRGQVLLYIMMMNKLGYQVSSGLLLYLKEGVVKEIPPSPAEQRDIIILRNELAYFLSRLPKIVETSEGNFLEPEEVPEPIDHPCCKKCPYNAICYSYSKYSNEDVSAKKSLKEAHHELGKFLTSAHINYFMHWTSLLSIEMPERNGAKELRDIYTLPPEERKNKGKCLIDLMVTKVEGECNGTFSHTFEARKGLDQPNFLLSGFIENTYIVVSVKNRPAVASGFLTDISIDSVTVCLDRNLNNKYEHEQFFLDSYDSTIFLTYNLGSLALILDKGEPFDRLRSIIIDKRPATFQPKLPKALADKARPILKRLNRVQQRAVLKAIAANEYFLIKGMPGTGKTATIVALVQLLIELNQTVLITSHTHSAVDTVCLKLIKFGINFMRLGNAAKIDQGLREYLEQNHIKDCNSPEALEAVYNKVPVLAVTCLGSGHPVLSRRRMDVCTVDESTQVLQCSVFRPLHAARKFILLGDPDQLPAVVKNRTAMELGMRESLFERLDTEESRVSLNLNYRMNEPITALANVLTYNGELEIGAERIAKASFNIPRLERLKKTYTAQSWLVKTLDTNIENAVQFVDTGPVWHLTKSISWGTADCYKEDLLSQENQKCLNIFEAAVIYRLVRALTLEGKVAADQIGVIATYRVQVALLSQLLNSTNVDVNTVDQFQGKDKNVIIYSCSKSRDLSEEWVYNKFDLTEDKRRLNVAITRAKHKLIIVGDLSTLEKYTTFQKIRGFLERNIIKLADCDDFNWDTVLDLNV